MEPAIARPNYNSFAHPMRPEDEHPPGAEYLKEASIGAWKRERQLFFDNTHGFREMKKDGENFCPICSYSITWLQMKPAPIHHVHHSLKIYRINKDLYDDGSYSCSICNIRHSADLGKRKGVLVTSGLLANWEQCWEDAGRKSDIHFDIISIEDATITELNQAFLAEYGREERPVDVVLVGGIEEVRNGIQNEEILRRITAFKFSVIGDSGNPSNSCAISLLPVPPSQNLSDIISNVSDLNKSIININRATRQAVNTHHAPDLWGMGRHKRKFKFMPPREGRWVGNSMVTKDACRMITYVERYFLDIFAIKTGKRADAKEDDKQLAEKFK